MNIFENNITILEKKYPEIARKIKEINMESTTDQVRIQRAEDGEKVIELYCRKHWWRLNSKISPKNAAAQYAERYEIRMYGVYFVYGIADGKSIRHLSEKCDDTNVMVVWEPNVEILAVALHNFDFEDLIANDNIILCVPEAEDNIDDILQKVVSYSNMKLIEFCILPNYDVIYTKQCEKFMQSCINKMQDEIVHKSTRLGFSRMIPQHMLFHMKNMISQRNIMQIREAFFTYPVKEIPAIIVSAGPSLDKNVKELQKAQGKAFIIVVDAALRTVLKAGVKPDLVCTIDPESPERFFEGMDLKDIIWMYGKWTRPWIFQQYGGKIFYQGNYTGIWNNILSDELGYKFPAVLTGGSVTSDAFMIADYIGFRKIILVGQDMAFTNGISHTSGIEGAFGDNDEYIDSRYQVYVEGIDGQKLKTDFQMWRYKKWFEKIIEKNEGRFRVINATEGGALIKGTINQRLRETISSECKIEFDGYKILNQIEPAFTSEQQEKLENKLSELKQEASELKNILKQNIENQNELIEHLEQNNQNEAWIADKLRAVMEQNAKIEQSLIMEFLTYYAQKEEYEVGDDIYADENMSIPDMIRKSVYLQNGYLKGVEMLQEDMDEYALKS